MKRNPLKTLLLLVFLGIVIVVASFISGIGNNFASRFLQAPIQKQDGYKPPSLQLTYTKDEKGQQENGLYRTDFHVSIHQPPGNFDTKFSIIGRIPEAECSEPKWEGTEQVDYGAIASTTMKYTTVCVSYRPIVDTGGLFTVEAK